MAKTGRNDICPCNSGKKYKKCCEILDMQKKINEIEKYSKGQSESSEILSDIKSLILEDYEDHVIIDITNDISIDNYKTYQIRNYSTKVIMLAERTENNSDFFIMKAGKSIDDFIVMYRGSYRIFNQNEFLSVYESVQKMINTRLAGIEDK
jgi:hypothetical protein